jgi:hypothetical protein
MPNQRQKSVRKCGHCRATGHDYRKCPKLDACPKKHADGRVCCKIINHEGACASVEGKWMISWKEDKHMSNATVPDVLKLNADDPFFTQLPPLSNQGAADALNVTRVPGLLEVTMRDEFAAYIRGWSDGAGIHAMRPEFTSHATLSTPYNEGYVDGRKARSMAHVAASKKFGMKLSILRTPEPITKTGKPTCATCIGITLWCVRRENHGGRCSASGKDAGT